MSSLSGRKVTLEASHAYEKPGTYFVVLRATAQRQGIKDAPYMLVKNLDRVRVVVFPKPG